MLTLVAPPLATIAMRFGPPEYTALLVLGLIFLAYMSSSSLIRTLLMACLGLLLGMIGIDNMTGHFRYSFDLAELGDGIGIVPVAVGLFGLGEILSTPSADAVKDIITPKLRDLLPTRKEWREAAMPITRGTLLGFIIGIIPGSAHIISSFLSYALEKRVSKHPEEFGKGAVAGVAGPETANNAASTGAFVPMLALGIPTSPITAVLIGALMIHGVSVGPTLVNDHPDVFWGFVASMYVGNVMLLLLNLPLVSVFVTVLRIPYAYLYPLIIMFCIIGVYEVNNSIVDVWIMLIMGVLGYALRKFDFDPAPLVLGLVISPILEQSLRQSLIMSNGNYLIFFSRPISLGLMARQHRPARALGLRVRAQARGLARQAGRGGSRRSGTVVRYADFSGVQRHGDQRGAAEDHVDADQQADCPGRRAWQAGENHHGQREIDDAAHQHPAPLAGQFALVIEREHDRDGALDQEERDQHQRERECAGQRRAQQHRADDNAEHGRQQRPPEARRMTHPETCDQPDDAAHQEQPAEQDRHRQGRDRRQDDGGCAQHQQYDAFDAERAPNAHEAQPLPRAECLECRIAGWT